MIGISTSYGLYLDITETHAFIGGALRKGLDLECVVLG